MATEAVYAGAMIEERQLLKSLRWYDGFVIALANPGFLLGALGGSIGVLGGWGAMRALGRLDGLVGVLQNWVYSEQAAMFPDKSGRHLALRARGLAQVLHARRAGRDVRLLVRLVGRARDLRLFIGYIIQAEWYPVRRRAERRRLDVRHGASQRRASHTSSRLSSSSRSGSSTSSACDRRCGSGTSPGR